MLNLNPDSIDYIIRFLTIGDIINFSCSCKNYYDNMNRFVYINVSINDIYHHFDIPVYRSYKEFQDDKTIELATGEFVITCHKEVTYLREEDVHYHPRETCENRYFIVITIDRSLKYNTYIFESHPWHDDDDYFPLLLHEERKEQFMNKTLSSKIKKMNSNEILSYPQKENLMTYSYIYDM